jgi:hypothetical protein
VTAGSCIANGRNRSGFQFSPLPPKSWMAPEAQTAYGCILEMIRVARERGKEFRDFDMRAPSAEEALAEMQSYLPSYSFIGPWSAEMHK